MEPIEYTGDAKEWIDQFVEEFLKLGGINTPDSVDLAKLIAGPAFVLKVPSDRVAAILADFQSIYKEEELKARGIGR